VEPVLFVEGVRAGYGAVEALQGVTLEVGEGEVVALVGSNGAGKTTTLLSISGIVRARAGRVVWEGREIQNRPPHEIVRLGIVHVPEGRRIFPRLTVLENLEMGAYARRDRAGVRADLERVYGLFPVLRDRRAQPGGTLSGGEQQMLAVGRALMARPRLLVLDEPSLGLAPLVARRIFEVLGELHRSGTSILLVEQNARAALGLAARGYVLEGGRVVLAGPARELLEDPRVRSAYLGG
jgi:branched-chain amino acid transport system ATP-binding protein